MKKTEFIRVVAKKNKVTKAQAAEFIDSIFDTIAESLSAGESVTFRNFGVFEVVEKPAHKGRNPRTGAEIDVVAKRKPVFRAGNPLKKAVNK